MKKECAKKERNRINRAEIIIYHYTPWANKGLPTQIGIVLGLTGKGPNSPRDQMGPQKNLCSQSTTSHFVFFDPTNQVLVLVTIDAFLVQEARTKTLEIRKQMRQRKRGPFWLLCLLREGSVFFYLLSSESASFWAMGRERERERERERKRSLLSLKEVNQLVGFSWRKYSSNVKGVLLKERDLI